MKTQISSRDYYFYRRHLYTIRYVFEFSGVLKLEQFAANLQTLAATLPVLTSRIVLDSRSTISLETSLKDIPLRFQEVAPENFSGDGDQVDSLVDQITNAEEEPLFKVVVTGVADKTYIGFSMSHLIGDGFSFFLALRVLSDIAVAGLPSIASLPSFQDRPTLRGYEPVEFADVSQERFFRTTGYVMPRPEPITSFRDEVLCYSEEDLVQLKHKASAVNPRVSTNDVVMADLLRRFHKSIPLAPDGSLIVRCPVDYRRIFPGLPASYFGNALKDAVAVFNPEEIEHLRFGETASRIRLAIDGVNLDAIKAELRCFDELRMTRGIECFEDIGCPGLLVSNLSRLPTTSLDFGCGKPLQFLTSSLNPRLAVILQAPGGDGLTVRFRKPIL